MNKQRCTTDGLPPRAGYENSAAPAPAKENGQHEAYWILCKEERQKDFIRPVRRSYIHVGLPATKYPLRDLTQEEHERYDKFGYIKFEIYPESEDPLLGKFWTQKELDKINNGCNTTTTMAQTIAETYAREPKFYGSTFCCYCGAHFPVEEFVWKDNPEERVGS